MAELLDVLDAFSTPLKVAWVVWLAWGVAQIYWYRYERSSQRANRSVAPPKKPFVSKPSMPERPTRLVTPEQVTPEQVTPEQVTPNKIPFDDAASGVGPGRISELDQFVASFEMNTRNRREQPLNGEQVPFGN